MRALFGTRAVHLLFFWGYARQVTDRDQGVRRHAASAAGRSVRVHTLVVAVTKFSSSHLGCSNTAVGQVQAAEAGEVLVFNTSVGAPRTP